MTTTKTLAYFDTEQISGLKRTNALAYYENSKLMAVKSFIRLSASLNLLSFILSTAFISNVSPTDTLFVKKAPRFFVENQLADSDLIDSL